MVRIISGLACLALLGNTVNAVSLPESKNTLHILPEHADTAPRAAEIVSPEHTLERRKGGGGRGGGGSSGGGSSGGGRSSGGGGSRTTGTSMTGGQTVAGSGPSRSFGRGGYYGGGAAVPYQAGTRSGKGLIAAPLIGGAAVLAIMPGFWLYSSVYPYHYNNPYRFYNRSRNATNDNDNNNARSIVIRQDQQGANETLPVVCLCQEFTTCGCDENDDQAYIDDLIGNGSYAALNKSIVTVSEVNNTRTLVLNGTLPNGTTAPGGVDDAAAGLSISRYSGYWVMGLVVLYGVML